MESHLLQMRGLKHQQPRLVHTWPQVASFTDAWIETNPIMSAAMSYIVASFTDAWIETAIYLKGYEVVLGRIFYRCVD